VQSGVDLRVAAAAQEDALLDLGHQLLPPPKEAPLADLERLLLRIAVVETKGRRPYSIIAADQALSTEEAAEEAFPLPPSLAIAFSGPGA
jgi:hypothetical protein